MARPRRAAPDSAPHQDLGAKPQPTRSMGLYRPTAGTWEGPPRTRTWELKTFFVQSSPGPGPLRGQNCAKFARHRNPILHSSKHRGKTLLQSQSEFDVQINGSRASPSTEILTADPLTRRPFHTSTPWQPIPTTEVRQHRPSHLRHRPRRGHHSMMQGYEGQQRGQTVGTGAPEQGQTPPAVQLHHAPASVGSSSTPPVYRYAATRG